jgi:hypothetical protein
MRRSAALLLALALAAPAAAQKVTLPADQAAYRAAALCLLRCPCERVWFYRGAAALPDAAWIWVEIEAERAGVYDPADELGPMRWKYSGEFSEEQEGEADDPCARTDPYPDWKWGFLYVLRGRLRGEPCLSDPYRDKYCRKAGRIYAWR